MSDRIKTLAKQKWFVPLILVLLAAFAASSFLPPQETTVESVTLETQIEDLCNSLEGVSNAKVMITYRSVPTATFFSTDQQKDEILGIAVLCNGGDNPYVQLSIHRLLETLFQISSTQITVSKKN